MIVKGPPPVQSNIDYSKLASNIPPELQLPAHLPPELAAAVKTAQQYPPQVSLFQSDYCYHCNKGSQYGRPPPPGNYGDSSRYGAPPPHSMDRRAPPRGGSFNGGPAGFRGRGRGNYNGGASRGGNRGGGGFRGGRGRPPQHMNAYHNPL